MPSLDECVVDRLALEMFDRQAATIATAISETSAVTPELARLQGIALAGIFQILTSEAGRRAARARPMTRSPTDSGQPSRRSSTTSIAGLRPAQAERPEWQDPRERQAELAARRAQNLVSATSAHLRGGPGVRSGPEIGLPQRRGLVAGARIADLLRSSHQAGATASGVIQQRLVARVERRTTAARAPLLVCHEHLQRESDLLILRKTAQLAGECFHGLGALRPDDPSGDEGASAGGVTLARLTITFHQASPRAGASATPLVQTSLGTFPLRLKTTRIALCPKSAVGPNMHGQPPSITAIPCCWP